MSGPIRGSIEHFLNGALQTSGSTQAVFVNVYNFMNNNTGTLGIRRIAYNSGSQNAGMVSGNRGMNFYDAPNPAGDNAWACFAFTSASIPWYVLIQWTGSGNTFGSAPGSPGLMNNNITPTHVFGVSIAQRVDGGNPWNGSSGSNGSDTKGTPVWHPGTSSLVVHPRSNNAVRAGTHGASRQNMMGFSPGLAASWRLQQVADYDNLALLLDVSIDNSYQSIIFGQYTPLSGVNPQIPYVSFVDALPLSPGVQYGIPGGNSVVEGGIGYPTVATSGTCSAGMDRYGTALFQNINAQPNRAFAVPIFDEFPLLVGLNEPNNQVGATGQIYDFFREVYNVATHDTNADGTRAAFGTATVAAVKLTIPWASGTVPGSGITRTGVSF